MQSLFFFCSFGFIEFGSTADATKAYDEMQNTEVDGRQVYLDFASPKGQGKSQKLFLLFILKFTSLALNYLKYLF